MFFIYGLQMVISGNVWNKSCTSWPSGTFSCIIPPILCCIVDNPRHEVLGDFCSVAQLCPSMTITAQVDSELLCFVVVFYNLIFHSNADNTCSKRMRCSKLDQSDNHHGSMFRDQVSSFPKKKHSLLLPFYLPICVCLKHQSIPTCGWLYSTFHNKLDLHRE